jgi:hypothetical protein
MSAPHAKNAATPHDGDDAPDSRLGARSAGTTRPLPPQLRPFAQALADLLLADLLKYPPKP